MKRADPFPTIVCICGSTRFVAEMNHIAEALTLGGCIVVRPEIVTYSEELDPQKVAPEVKKRLDELHFRKIELSDEIFVVNVDGYVGQSTGNEIAYAKSLGKRIRFLVP